MSKTCRGCGELKPLSDFTADSRTKDGTRSRCRACTREVNRQWRTSNAEHVQAYSQGAAQTRKEYQREWRRANPDRIREYRRRGRQPGNDFLRQWRAANT